MCQSGQVSIYGAVADVCNELDPDYAESETCESLVIPTESSNANTTSELNIIGTGGLVARFISRNSQNFLKIRNCRNFAKMLVS